ncbi:MAG: hypothetical protein LWW92_14040 [Rhodocyclales bacterium]|nr:hypothetical protein [Rhodocyclales bacterium]
MAMPICPCPYCKTLVPVLPLSPERMDGVMRAIHGEQPALAVLELMDAAACKKSEALAWLAHREVCVPCLPLQGPDAEVLGVVVDAFAGMERPDHFTDITCCEECRDHDATLAATCPDTLQRKDLGHVGWNPLSFCTGEATAYLFPALVRITLHRNAWPRYEWYGCQLLWKLAQDKSANTFWHFCTPRQRQAVAHLLAHLLEHWADLISDYQCDDEYLAALTLWAE